MFFNGLLHVDRLLLANQPNSISISPFHRLEDVMRAIADRDGWWDSRVIYHIVMMMILIVLTRASWLSGETFLSSSDCDVWHGTFLSLDLYKVFSFLFSSSTTENVPFILLHSSIFLQSPRFLCLFGNASSFHKTWISIILSSLKLKYITYRFLSMVFLKQIQDTF